MLNYKVYSLLLCCLSEDLIKFYPPNFYFKRYYKDVKNKYMLGEDFSMLDVAIAPLLWRLDHYGIEMPKTAAPLLRYAERIFSRTPAGSACGWTRTRTPRRSRATCTALRSSTMPDAGMRRRSATASTRGSMHGEVGHTQFLPKNVLQYGVGGSMDNAQTALGADGTATIVQSLADPGVRKRLVEAARKLEQGGEPPGLHAADYRYRGISLEMPRERTDWQNAILPYMDPRPDTFVESI